METLIANITGKVRKENLNGKEYLVAPVTLLVPGVLNGSKGPLLYPRDEVTKNADSWNHIPLVVYHPTNNGMQISARDPEVLENQGVGFVFKATATDQGKLVSEAWFDIAATERIDNRVLDSLNSGKKIEISTGLFTENEPREGITENGVSYEFIARNYRPDHLAILPDQKGACSIEDGCGVLANKEGEESSSQDHTNHSNHEVNNMACEKLVAELIANCSCWSEDDQEVLANLGDEKVQGLLDAAKSAKANAEAIENAAKEEEIEEPVSNEVAEEKVEPVANEKPQTAEEWFKSAPAEIQSAVQNAVRIEQREKDALIEKLIANQDDAAKEVLKKRLASKSLEELADLSLLVPEKVEEPTSNVSFFGASGGAPVTNNKVTVEPLSLPSIDWKN